MLTFISENVLHDTAPLLAPLAPWQPSIRVLRHNPYLMALPPPLRRCAAQQVRHGEALVLCYGARDNSDLLLSYGFVLPANPHDKVWLEFDTELLAVSGAWCRGGGDRPDTRECCV